MSSTAVKNMERKITKIGNSLGVTLPQEVLDHLNAKQGDEIKFILEENGKVTIKKYIPKDYSVFEDFDQDFIDGLKDLFDRYNNTLRNLAEK
ncbi:AbrB/MazE/SpoVT family DNA-binding domain-containing protein [Caenibacillus caldisaponilyticus]|uniref:AbrB/MazE/SpoVT family DNA-binding domain-containing protein n=1 Tax=Caenibacillus caldisaponilyticus TaxID=1674942 RepID=UPI001178BA01|nr:AbrB/MazE/SpoVT family DNA-binding domain-containing protein [Caenibacillus caldisaponilyticus]